MEYGFRSLGSGGRSMEAARDLRHAIKAMARKCFKPSCPPSHDTCIFLEEGTIGDVLRLKQTCKDFKKGLEYFVDVYYNGRLYSLLSSLEKVCETVTEHNRNQDGVYPPGVSGIYTASLISSITYCQLCALKQGHTWYNINFRMSISKWHQLCDMNRQRRSSGTQSEGRVKTSKHHGELWARNDYIPRQRHVLVVAVSHARLNLDVRIYASQECPWLKELKQTLRLNTWTWPLLRPFSRLSPQQWYNSPMRPPHHHLVPRWTLYSTCQSFSVLHLPRTVY